MSAPDALAEAVHQLIAERHQPNADMVLDRCSREVLATLLESETHVLTGRTRYVVEAKLRLRRVDHHTEELPPLKVLMHVLNVWCVEGWRLAIHRVLAELDAGELAALADLPGLDPEIVSMTRNNLYSEE
ncbi:hypothetical protein [Pinirhizobacter soli]|uniref:hypothetical protein n=1 Tax=Pinirhizobacter soli TaxID=2786953 RepID=UPI002029D890|nr:hypothetical protein [Pinirhizobacter soli]